MKTKGTNIGDIAMDTRIQSERLNNPYIYPTILDRYSSLGNLIKKKIFVWIDASPISSLLLVVFNFFLFFISTSWVLYPREFLYCVEFLFTVKEYALVKIILAGIPSFSWIYAFRAWKARQDDSLIKEKQKTIKKEEIKAMGTNSILGIDSHELFDHLWTNKTFKQIEICEKFKITPKQHTKLGKKFDDEKICIRDKANKRILDPKISQQELANAICDAKNLDEIHIPMKIVQNGKSSISGREEISKRINRIKAF